MLLLPTPSSRLGLPIRAARCWPGRPPGNLIADEIEKWSKIVKFVGIKPE